MLITEENEMLHELFGTYTGLLTVAVIVFMLGMFVFFYRMFLKNEAEELKK
jgi:hypothetical protein